MQPIERTFSSWDGTELVYRAWLPTQPIAKSILLFHRGHEHSRRWQQTVDSLALSDVAFFAWDQRGHGKSPGDRGNAPNIAALTKDCQSFTLHLQTAYGLTLQDTAVIASSVGAVIATAWVHDFAPPICGMILAAPAFRVKLYVPLAIPGLRILQKVLPKSKIKSYVKSKMITHDPQQAAAYDADPLIFRQIAVNMLLDLYDTSTRILNDAGAIQTPTLILSADQDWVVKLSAQKKFFERLGSPIKQMEVFPRTYHSLFHEADREKIIDRVRDFLRNCFDHPTKPVLRYAEEPDRTSNKPGSSEYLRTGVCDNPLLCADQGGFTRTEYDLLRAPGSPHWSIVRFNLKTFGKLSQGIRVGWNTGFDSGRSLDYIYENKPRGITPLGKIIDYFYLNAIGWRGIRIRRENLQRMLRAAIERLNRAGQPIQILDIASGPGRYVLETLSQLVNVPAGAMLRDYQQPNLDAAKKLAEELQLQNITFQQGDAFDRESLAAITPRPTIAIASGLYELFPDNEPILKSLQGIAAAMDAGGYLIYTCQPWHPQVEFIARVLTNREGKPWIMRRRTQAEMDALVQSAGFEKIEQDIDPFGIFTVSVARRISQ